MAVEERRALAGGVVARHDFERLMGVRQIVWSDDGDDEKRFKLDDVLAAQATNSVGIMQRRELRNTLGSSRMHP